MFHECYFNPEPNMNLSLSSLYNAQLISKYLHKDTIVRLGKDSGTRLTAAIIISVLSK